ncbi:MAG: aspartyl protease family protein, partial [Gemmatimonadaceae bacterium]
MTDFARHELRVNVVWRGGRRVFVIRRAGAVEVDSVGPVIDMFATQVSPGATDYAVSTESTRLWSGAPVSGEAPLLYARPTQWESGYLLARGVAGVAEDGYFVVDLAAGRTVISRHFLPPGITLRRFSRAESAGEDERAAAGSLMGVGGAVEHVVGATTLPALRIGSISFDSADVLVLDSLSRIGGRPIAGVLGLDLMRRATRLTISYPRGQSRAAVLTLGHSSRSLPRARARLPMSIASGHVFFRGVLGTLPVDLVLDSGSPYSFLSDRAAIIAGLDDLQPAGTVSGLDGSAISVRIAKVPRLQLGETVYRGLSFHVARLPVFRGLGLTDPAGLLGNDFLERFRVVEVDFESRVLLLRP